MLEAIDPEVARTQLQVLGRRLGEVLEAADRVVLEEIEELSVLRAVHKRVETQQSGLVGGAQIAEADPDGVGTAGAAPDLNRCRGVAVALVVDPRLTEAHVVRVRVEHDDPQVGLHQQALEQHAEGVGLARARLATQEGVAAEAVGIEPERHAAGERELPHVELGAVGTRGLEPGAHLVRSGATHQGVVERALVAVENDAVPTAGADADLPEARRGGVLVAELERQQLTQAGGAVRLDRHVAARLELQPVQRYLEVEAPAVDGCRERQHGGLERLARPAILLERSVHVGHIAILRPS